MPDETDKKLVNVREAAKECGRNMETVRRWIWSGKLPAEKLGNQLFIKREDLTTFCRETAVLEYEAKPKADFINLEFNSQGNTTMKHETQYIKTGDFLERAIRLQDKLRARGYPEIDTVTLVKKSREGHASELRQSLR